MTITCYVKIIDGPLKVFLCNNVDMNDEFNNLVEINTEEFVNKTDEKFNKYMEIRFLSEAKIKNMS